MANAGGARLRFDYEHMDLCLECKLDPCVLDIPGQSESLRCPFNRLKAEEREQRAKAKQAA